MPKIHVSRTQLSLNLLLLKISQFS